MSEVSTTSTNIAAASRIASRGFQAPSSSLLAGASAVIVCTSSTGRRGDSGPWHDRAYHWFLPRRGRRMHAGLRPQATAGAGILERGVEGSRLGRGERAQRGPYAARPGRHAALSTCFAAAMNWPLASSAARSAARRAPAASSGGRRAPARTTSGNAAAMPDTVPIAPRATPAGMSGSLPMRTGSPSSRYGSTRSKGDSLTFSPARLSTDSRDAPDDLDRQRIARSRRERVAVERQRGAARGPRPRNAR